MTHKFLIKHPRLLALGTASVIALAAPLGAIAANPADAPVLVANDRVADVRDLLAQGWNPNTVIKGQPAIMQAVRDGAWGVFDVLAAYPRTDVNLPNSFDETPLMYLAIQGQAQRAKILIARGAQVNRLGWTPLHYAASKGQLDVARLLLAHQAIVNAPGPDGTTPLMMAGYAGSGPMVELLLNAGADASMRNLQGLDASAWARSAKHDALAAELEQAAAARQAQLGKPPGAGAAPAAGGRSPAQSSTTGPTPGGSSATQSPAAAPTPGGSSVSPSSGASPAGNAGEGQNTVRGVEGIRLDPNAGPSSR
jgi:ankyrin repeat protein